MRREIFLTKPVIFLSLVLILFSASCSTPKVTTDQIEHTAGKAAATATSITDSTKSGESVEPTEGVETVDEAQFSALITELHKRKDPLNMLLDMRSISIKLSINRPDGSSGTMQIDIDENGNMHIINEMAPEVEVPAVPENSTLPKDTTIEKKVIDEILVVDGKAFHPNNLLDEFLVDPWMSNPVDNNYLTSLSIFLHGKDGPALWLNRLPEGSLNDAGDDSVGGFNAYKYAVQGMVEGKEITGYIWYEQDTNALIKADLVIPAALYEYSNENPQGQFTVKLETKKSNIPVIKLPAAPILPTEKAMSPTAVQKEADLPADSVSSPPAIAAFYPLDMSTGMGGIFGTLETSPGKVWIGLVNNGIQEWDANSGSVIRTIPIPEITVFWDLKFDGKNLWALASKENMSEADGLYVIDPAAGKIVKEWHEFKQGDFGWQPVRLGLSSGKIWVANKIIDTTSLEEIPMGKKFVLPTQAHFAFDGQKWMWASGSRCEGCGHDLWMFDSTEPEKVKDDGGTGEANASTMNMPVVMAGGKIWVGAFKNSKTVNWISTSDTYISGYDPTKTDKPSVSVDVSGEVGDPNWITSMEAGSRFLWLFGAAYKPPTLFYHDLKTGKVLGKLPIETMVINDIAYDGKDLWVLGMDKLVRVSEP
jgi:hypothetical protein